MDADVEHLAAVLDPAWRQKWRDSRSDRLRWHGKHQGNLCPDEDASAINERFQALTSEAFGLASRLKRAQA